ANDRRAGESLAVELDEAIRRFGQQLKEQQQRRQAYDERQIRTLESELNRIQARVEAAQREATEQGVVAQQRGKQVLALRLAMEADRQRLANNFEDAYLLAANALALANEVVKADIDYYFSLVIRDSEVAEQYPIRNTDAKLTILPNHILSQNSAGVQVLDRANGTAIADFPKHSCQYLKSEQALLLDSQQVTLKYYDLLRGQLAVLGANHQEALTAVKPWTNGIATLSRDDQVKIWRQDGTLLTQLAGHRGNVYDLHYLPQQAQFVTRSSDGTVLQWDKEGQLLDTLAESAYVYTLDFSPSRQMLVAGTGDGEMISWSTSGVQLLATTQAVSTAAVAKTTFLTTQEGQEVLLILTADGNLQVRKLANWNTSEPLKRFTNVSDFRVSPALGCMIAWDRQGQVVVYDGVTENRWQAHQGMISGIDIAEESGRLLTTATDQTVKLWTLDGQQHLHWPLTRQPAQQKAQFSPDERAIFVPFFQDNLVTVHPAVEPLMATARENPPPLSAALRAKYQIPDPGNGF
ncbi:MAG: hypothetical protein AAGJ82_05465, partial [Bacteroidota bacterium]